MDNGDSGDGFGNLAGRGAFGEYYPYVVLSGSMEPVYPVGSMIYVKKQIRRW